jgi:hypothetical protein
MSINTTLSNLYVEKVSSEHPLALWMLNEQVDYVSQITDAQRNFYDSDNWDIVDGTVVDASAISGAPSVPIIDSSISKIAGSIPATSTQDIILTSSFSIPEANLVQELSNIGLGFYLYIDTALANSVSFGYSYINSSSVAEESLSTVLLTNSDRLKWKFFSNTLELPAVGATDIKIIVKINIDTGGGSEDYNFYISGLSLGQWSEDFNKYSYGVNPTSIPSDINLPTAANFKALPAYPYGTSDNSGYYLSQGYSLSCKNFGIPMVYGSYNITKLYPNVYNQITYPSLIFPGSGFLNERGRYNEYTVEMWIKINASATTPRKIFGPIASTDGLYADHAHLSFKLGSQVKSHFVGEWFRPMLVHIRLLKNSLIVVLNGEEVISLTFEQDTISLASEFVDGKGQDWLGFYSYEDVDPVDLDTFSIYSYAMPTQVAKRHWVWGQAVIAPEQTNSAINSITAFNDYAFANYTANYNYPDFANWKQAFFSNVEAGSKILSLPDYQLPEFSIGTNTVNDLYEAISEITATGGDTDDAAGIKYLTLKPNANSEWSSESHFLYFDKLGLLNEPVETVYGIFKTSGTEANSPLFKVTNKLNNDFFLVSINGTTVTYSVTISGTTTTIATKTIEVGKKFAAGFNVQNLISSQTVDFGRFFADTSSLDIFLAGDGSKKFSGRVYKFGFNAAYNNRKISSLYDQFGILSSTIPNSNTLFSHTANYTLTTINEYGLLFPDIAVAGYWEDYIPLSYFSKGIIDYDGNQNYELDFIQLNLDFPEPPAKQSTQTTSAWTYQDLKDEYWVPELLTYGDLENSYYTGWENYEDMSGNTIITNFYNTDEDIVKSYVSFQKISDGANKNLIEFTNYYKPLISGILDPDNINSLDWKDTAYQVTNGTIIYPPKEKYSGSKINFSDYAIVCHLEFISNGILHSPVRLRDLQLASQVLERTTFTSVGSKLGVPVYYYSRSGLYFDLKGKNPITTYKKSTPHLYLNRQSGWSVKGDFSPTTDRGLSIVVNESRSQGLEVALVQMWVRFYQNTFPTGAIMIFSISHKDGIIDFFLEADSTQKRGFVFGVNRESLEIIDTLEYSINGNSVNTPFLINEEWTALSIKFPDLLSFDEVSGTINLNGPLMYNNISYKLATNIEKSESIETRTWLTVEDLDDNGTDNTWGYIAATWKLPEIASWQDVQIISQSQELNIDLEAIYGDYVGSNRIVVDDNTGLLVNPEKITAYKEISWESTIKTPA